MGPLKDSTDKSTVTSADLTAESLERFSLGNSIDIMASSKLDRPPSLSIYYNPIVINNIFCSGIKGC